MNYVVSRGSQKNADNPVRRDTFTERISEKPDYMRPDGTSYLPEYLAFMDNCWVSTGVTDPIEEIILEEADAFFAGDKDVRTVAGIIQSRAQLYLNENW